MKFIITSEDTKFVIYANEPLNKRTKLYICNTYNAEFINNQFLINKHENSSLISKFSDYCKKHSYELELDDESDKTLEKLYNEEKRFQEFSKKAELIWNNSYDKSNFIEFTKVVQNNMYRTLYPLQLLAAYHLTFSQNSCNFSVPGAGKTSIVYGSYSYLSNLETDNPKYIEKILVIGPLSSFGPWESEYESCFNEQVVSKRLSGSYQSYESKKKYFYSLNTSKLTLMSYQGIIGQTENIISFLKNNKVMVVLDEAHKIKNTDGGKIAESILKIAPYAKSRIVLTGTPAPNGYRDLYNLFKFIWPQKDLVKFGLNQLDDMTDNQNDNRINILINNLKPYFVRIRKRDLGLPKKIENDPIVVEMDDLQKAIYEKLENKVMNDIIKEKNNTFVSKLKSAKFIRLMQAASNPYLLLKPLEEQVFEGEELLDDELETKLIEYKKLNRVPPKFEEAYNLITELINKGEKVIVWAIYVDTIERFSDYLNSKNINTKILYGKTLVESENLDEKIETREKIINRFHEVNSEFKVIIANPFAVAESISLHKACHCAIYLERNFDAARFVQSKDRIHRYGLDMKIVTNYYYINTRSSLDEVIDERLRQKEELMIRVSENTEIPLFQTITDETYIDENDIKGIIENYVKRT
ncbi:DEAD/DEAH box helicase [Mammaliicoccus vitulinus]|uniref:DEAD/DEAH box helicase n=1 Tax=Mammaliicoccus vitulinus TaxID=71237 RepID=UPI003BA0FDB8